MSLPPFHYLGQLRHRLVKASEVIILLDFGGSHMPIVEHPPQALLSPPTLAPLGLCDRNPEID